MHTYGWTERSRQVRGGEHGDYRVEADCPAIPNSRAPRSSDGKWAYFVPATVRLWRKDEWTPRASDRPEPIATVEVRAIDGRLGITEIRCPLGITDEMFRPIRLAAAAIVIGTVRGGTVSDPGLDVDLGNMGLVFRDAPPVQWDGFDNSETGVSLGPRGRPRVNVEETRRLAAEAREQGVKPADYIAAERSVTPKTAGKHLNKAGLRSDGTSKGTS